MDQLIIPKFVFFFILITHLIDIVLLLLGEILSWSHMGVKGLINFMNSHLASSVYQSAFREHKNFINHK